MATSHEKITRWQQLKEKRVGFNNTFTLIARYVDMMIMDFESNTYFNRRGNVIPDDVMDNTASHVSTQAASSMLGSLWPNGAASFKLIPHPHNVPDSEAVRAWFRDVVNPAMHDKMDDPQSGLEVALDEVMHEAVNYGTGSLGVFRRTDKNLPIRFKTHNIKCNYIDEGPDGKVDTNYFCQRMTVKQIIQEYGEENVSQDVIELARATKLDDEVEVLTTIEPRDIGKQNRVGLLGAPFERMDIEVETGKVLKESGFGEFPVPTVRFSKKVGEVWGRGPGINALPEIIEINAIMEAATLAIEKLLDPPLALLDDGRLGAGDIDTSPGALNVLTVSGKLAADKVISPIFTVGDFHAVIPLIEKLVGSIKNHYYLDRLLDLNNQTEMTLGEANIRNSLRGDSLVSVYRRFSAELFTPMVIRVFNILLEDGFFGVVEGSVQEALLLEEDAIFVKHIPNEVIAAIMQGLDIYKIEYISPAARMMQSQETSGLISTMEIIGNLGRVLPNVVDNFDTDGMVKRLAQLLGVSIDVLKSTEAVQASRQLQAQAAQQQSQIDQAREVSEINRNNSQAQATANGSAIAG